MFPIRSLLPPLCFAAGCLALAGCGPKFAESYSGPGLLPGTWYHEVAGFSDYPHTDTYEFRVDGVMEFRYTSPKYNSYSWTGKWKLLKDSLITTQDDCGTDPETQVAIRDCQLSSDEAVYWDASAQRVFRIWSQGIYYLTYSR